MRKKLFIIFLILVFLGSTGIIYLNNVILPTKIKSLIVTALAEQTQKKVTLGGLKFSIFKGLVLRNLVIWDAEEAIIGLNEASCIFLIPPIFQRKIIIPFISLKSPEIFLQRRKDATFNLQDLFAPKTARSAKPPFSILVSKVKLSGARIHFQDDTFSPPFSKNIENLNLNLYLSSPASVKFKLSATSRGGSARHFGGKVGIPSHPLINIEGSGEFKILQRQLRAKVSLQNFPPREFLAYYQNLGIDITDGLINCLVDLEFKEGILNANLSVQNKNLNITRANIKALLDSDIGANLQYNLQDKQLKFSGKGAINNTVIQGLEFVGEINGIKGEVSFNNSGVFSDKLSANVFGMPVEAKINLSDFNNPLLNMDIASTLSLSSLQGIIKDKFKLAFPGDIKGEANLSLNIKTKIPLVETPQVNGYLDILNAILKLEKVSSPVENINGRVEFSQGLLKWPKLNFKYLGVPYTTQGRLANFQAPQVELNLSSRDLSLDSVFAINHNLLNLSKISGKYLNSGFQIAGDINTADASKLDTNINGQLNINLEDLKEPLKKFKDRLEQIKPSGLLEAQFSLNGNINDIKSCAITAKLSGSSISAYGLKTQGCALEYNQAEGLIEIPVIDLSLYDGRLKGTAKMNLTSANLPYWIEADIQGVRIEKLKLDTAAKEKDIAGIVNAQVKVNGFSNDLAKINGVGAVNITEGKLWQLNLFKGLGSLLFARDFANIVFSEGSCSFTIQDKYIFSDNLQLKSNITNLSGSAKIGFDSSIEAALGVEILDEAAPLTGTLKDIATTILGQGNRFGVIKISGTIKEPKYKFQPAVVDIIKGLKDAFFGK